MKATTPWALGWSRDERTNRWRVTCPKCTREFEPQTTMSRYQIIDCPKCKTKLRADYNAPTVEVSA